jgi:hypothetical protein
MSYAESLHQLLDYVKLFLWMSPTRLRQAETAFGHGEGTCATLLPRFFYKCYWQSLLSMAKFLTSPQNLYQKRRNLHGFYVTLPKAMNGGKG